MKHRSFLIDPDVFDVFLRDSYESMYKDKTHESFIDVFLRGSYGLMSAAVNQLIF